MEAGSEICFTESQHIQKHARWWTRVYGSGLKEVEIFHRAGKQSSNVNALSRNPCGPAPIEGIGESEVQIASVSKNAIDDDVGDIFCC